MRKPTKLTKSAFKIATKKHKYGGLKTSDRGPDLDLNLAGPDDSDDELVADPPTSILPEDDDWGSVGDTPVAEPESIRSAASRSKFRKPGRGITAPKNKSSGRKALRSKSKLPAGDFSSDPDARLNLPQCNTTDDVRKQLRHSIQQFERKGLRAIEKRNLDDKSKMRFATLFTERATSIPIMTNPKVMLTAAKTSAEMLYSLTGENVDMEMAFVTTISGDCLTSHARPIIDLHTAQTRKQATLRAMAPNYFGITELALFNSHGAPGGGQLLQIHDHALIWGPNVINKAREVGARHANRYTANTTGAKPIDIRKVEISEVNIARVSGYMFKPPYRCKSWNPPKGDRRGHMNESEKGDRYMRYLRMALIRSMISFEDATYASGQGRVIRSTLVKLLRAMCEADAPPTVREFHPDAMGAFAVQIAKELGQDTWTLPVIALRP